MAEGQGASMALPIYGRYISKVYADPTLPYNQNTRFNFPAGVDLCGGELLGEPEPEEAEEAIEGMFD